jgi:CRISPR/Cas system-associated exonuclease Cas4 (RecB family)
VIKLAAEPQYPMYGELGSRAHAVIEHFYKNVTVPCAPEEHFDDLIGRLYLHEFSAIEDYKKNMIGGLLNFLDMEITRYYGLENKELFVPKYNELYIKSEINNIPFSGRVDAVYEKPDGTLVGVDYKFTSSNSIGDTQKQQATIYAILLEKELGIHFDSFEFWFLRHKKRTIKSIKITDKTISDVNKKVKVVEQLIDSMSFNRKPSWLCRYCDYQGICLEEQAAGL